MPVFISCNKSKDELVQDAIHKYLKEHLQSPDKYESLCFSPLDSLVKPDTIDANTIIRYGLIHHYKIKNSKNREVILKMYFGFDEKLNLLDPSKYSTNYNSMDGEFGNLEGNAFWKYNDYVGNKPDAGAHVSLINLDSLNNRLTFNTEADINGDFQINDIPPGCYLLAVQSNNVTENRVSIFDLFKSYYFELNKAYGFGLCDSLQVIKEVDQVDSLIDVERKNGNYFSKNIDKLEEFKIQKINKYFEFLMDNKYFNLNLYSTFPNKIRLKMIWIDSKNTDKEIIDFGVTYN